MSYSPISPAPVPESILAPAEILVVSLLESTNAIQIERGHVLQPNPDGIYLSSKVIPVIRPGNVYYDYTTKELVDYKDVGKCKHGVMDQYGRVLISEADIRKKQSRINRSGFYPVSAFNIVCLSIYDVLKGWCPYTVPMTPHIRLNDCLIESDECQIEDFYSYVGKEIEEIHDFVRKDDWNIYYIKIKGTNLYIEKSIDYRIYEWTRLQYEKENPNDEHDF